MPSGKKISVESLTPSRIATMTLGSKRSLYFGAGMGYRGGCCWARTLVTQVAAIINAIETLNLLMKPPRSMDRRTAEAPGLICPDWFPPPAAKRWKFGYVVRVID